MKTIEYQTSFENLQNYMTALHQGAKISFNEYLKQNSEYKDNYDVSFRANLNNIKFDANHIIDLTGADLSNTILENLEFNGKYVLLRQANLIGCDLSSCRFTNNIDLTDTNLGNIILKSEVFQKCNLLNAIYDPTQPKVAKIKVTEKQLEQYIHLRNNNQAIAQDSLNDYLSHILRHYYPERTIFIADLSLNNEERIIDEKFNNADLSGSIFENCTFTGNLHNLILRDCHFNQTVFKDCTLYNADLRGTPLTTINNITNQFISIIAEGIVQFVNPKLSISWDTQGTTINQAIKTGVLSQDINVKNSEHDFTIKTPILDPNYVKGSTKEEAQSIASYKKYTVQDIEEYTIYCRQLLQHGALPSDLPDFKSFIIDTYKIPEQDRDFIPDLSNLDLSYMDLSFLKLDGCNFAYSKFNASNLRHTSLNNCNLSGTDFSSIKRFFFRQDTTYLSNASIQNSDLTAAKLNNVDASSANFSESIAINIEAENININSAHANGTNFAGSWLLHIKASKLQAIASNFTYIFSRNSTYKLSILNNSNLSYSDFSSSDFTEAELNYTSLIGTRLRKTNLTRTKLTASRLQTEISNTILYETNLENADLAGLFHEAEQEPNIEKTDFSNAITSEKQYVYGKIQLEQLITKKVKNIYDKYAIGIVLCAIALPVITIALANIALPTALAVTVTAATTAIAVPIVSVFSAVIAMDRIIHNKLGFSFSLTSTLSNMFGAKTIVKKSTKDLEQDIQEKEKWIINHDNELHKQEKIETDIKKSISSAKSTSNEKWLRHVLHISSPPSIKRREP
ncbi:MAG: pentapeptide repeat-containing protein [Rickettsiales endosymbiont of Dermacentor nuttalli]